MTTGVGVIGLAGLARSGKDTAADHLVARHGYRRIAFADAIRNALVTLDPLVRAGGTVLPLSHLVERHGWDAAKSHPDVRRLLQRFGTEVGRTLFGDTVWIDLALRGVTPGDRVVITDVRFPNEVDAVHRLGGIVVLLERPGAGLAGAVAGHASEAMAFTPDRRLCNDQDLAHLSTLVDHLVANPK